SSSTGVRFAAAATRILRAVPALPVKLILSTSGCETSVDVPDGPESTMLTTPGGIPASRHRRPNRMDEYGASSGGLITTVLPAASAGAAFMPISHTGPLNGTIAATTPYGS